MNTRLIFAVLIVLSIKLYSFPLLAEENEDVDEGPQIDFGGALRFNAFVKNWEGEENTLLKFGELQFDTWRINADVTHNNFSLSAEYRFYQGYSFLKHGWIGYDFSEQTNLKAGIHQVPFGLLPYTAHNWFLMLPYYIGLEDDYNTGLKLRHRSGNWEFHGAFYKNTPGHFTGSSENSSRYSYDLVADNEEINQGNLRVAYNLGSNEIGISGQYGQLFNNRTEEFGHHYAAAAHLDSDIGPFNLKLQALHYLYDPDEYSGEEGMVTMGAYDFPYQVAAGGEMYTAGLSYKLDVDWGPLSSLTFYNNFTYFDKADPDFKNSQMNVAGFMGEMESIYFYFDAASGQSHPWIGPVWSEALARGIGEDPEEDDPESTWATRFNLNVGYYF